MVQRKQRMICKICGKVTSPYKVYELSCDLKADSYICKGCFLKETLNWNINHPNDTKHIQVFNDMIVVSKLREDEK